MIIHVLFYSQVNESIAHNTTYSYDELGNLTKIEDKTNKIKKTIEMNAKDQLGTQIVMDTSTQTPTIIKTVLYKYNPVSGNLEKIME